MSVHVNPLMAVLPAEKYCPACKRILPREAFYRNSIRKDGLRGRCWECEKAGIQSPNMRYKPKPPEPLRPWKVGDISSVRLEYRDKPPWEGWPPGWYLIIEDGAGVLATDAEVWMWHKIQMLQAQVKLLEARR